MPLHIRSFEVNTDGGTLYATLQYGPVKLNEKEGLGVRVALSRRLSRKNAAEVKLGVANLNNFGEMINLPEGVSEFEVQELEKQIKEKAQ